MGNGAFDFLKEYVVSDEHEKNNKKHIFYRLSPDTIEKAEEALGRQFPEQLKKFYIEIGYGYFYDKEMTDINLFMSPRQIVDYYQGTGNYVYSEDREFKNADELVFFELDSNIHMTIKTEGENTGKIFFGHKTIAAEDLESFVKLLDENSGYYF